MKAKLFQNSMIVKKSRIHGYGVFAQKDIRKGELVEECYCLLFKSVDEDCLIDYAFAAGRKKSMVLTGNGCIYNHSDDHNVDHLYDEEKQIMRFKARRAIKQGEEMFITYGNDWFQSRDLKAKANS